MADPKSLRQVAAQQANAAKQRQVKRPEEMDEQVVPAEGAEASAQPVAEAAYADAWARLGLALQLDRLYETDAAIDQLQTLIAAKPVAPFGAVPQAEIEAFLDRVVPAPSEADLLAAAGDEASLRQALELDPGHPAAIAALASTLTSTGRAEEALELLSRIPETPELRALVAEARLAQRMPMAACPCWSWFMTSSVLDARAFGVM